MSNEVDYEERPLIDDFVDFLRTWDDFKKAHDKLLERVKEIEPSTYDLQVYNAIYTNGGKGRTSDCLYENINDEYDLCYAIENKQTYVIWLSKEEREERKNAQLSFSRKTTTFKARKERKNEQSNHT